VAKTPESPFKWEDFLTKIHNPTCNDVCNRYFGRELKLNNIDPVLWDQPKYVEYLIADPRSPSAVDMTKMILENFTGLILHLETIQEDWKFLNEYYKTGYTAPFPHNNKKKFKFGEVSKEDMSLVEEAVALDQEVYDWSYELKKRQKAKLREEKE
jgi:hypothetical protein